MFRVAIFVVAIRFQTTLPHLLNVALKDSINEFPNLNLNINSSDANSSFYTFLSRGFRDMKAALVEHRTNKLFKHSSDILNNSGTNEVGRTIFMKGLLEKKLLPSFGKLSEIENAKSDIILNSPFTRFTNQSLESLGKMFERVKRIKRFSRLVGVVMKLESCDSTQCNNGATCLTNVLYEGGFECMCKPGYYGPLCDQTSEDCMYNPCMNGAMCISVYDGYVCGCPPKFSGKHCEIGEDRSISYWLKELQIDKYVTHFAFATFAAAMCGFLLLGSFCCCLESKRMELRQRNEQYQDLAKTLGMQHLYEEEFVNHSYLNAFAELMIDGGYAATKIIAWILSLPQIVNTFVQTRAIKQTGDVERHIARFYQEQQKKGKWWNLYLKAREEMREEDVKEIIGIELKKAMAKEMKKAQENETRSRVAAKQLTNISYKLDAKTNEALQSHNPHVPMTTMKNMALTQGMLSSNFIDQLNIGTQNLNSSLLPVQQARPMMPLLGRVKGRESLNVTLGQTKANLRKGMAGIQSGLLDAMGPDDITDEMVEKEFKNRKAKS